MTAMTRIITALAALSLLSGCYGLPQYSSGGAYLAELAPARAGPLNDDKGQIIASLDDRVAEAANVEPDLRLPGRFGLARLIRGRLTDIPEAEAKIWKDLAARHADFGTFSPVSPLVASLTSASVGLSRWRNPRAHAMEQVRLGAARQHLDTVLIYEAGANSVKENTALALADLTIIGGALLPTRHITTTGKGTAILVDVRTGYSYGVAAATSDLSAYFTSWGSDRKQAEMRAEAMLAAVADLAPKVEDMLIALRREVEARR